MKDHCYREIEKLKRERKAVDKAIADFERLEAKIGRRPPGRAIFTASGNLIQMNRKREPSRSTRAGRR
jgi:hypothetical protein